MKDILSKFASKRSHIRTTTPTTTLSKRNVVLTNKITKSHKESKKQQPQQKTNKSRSFSSSHESNQIQQLVLNEKFVASTVLFAVGDSFSCCRRKDDTNGTPLSQFFAAKNQKISKRTLRYSNTLRLFVDAFEAFISSSKTANTTKREEELLTSSHDELTCHFISEFLIPRFIQKPLIQQQNENDEKFAIELGIAIGLFCFSSHLFSSYESLCTMCIELFHHHHHHHHHYSLSSQLLSDDMKMGRKEKNLKRNERMTLMFLCSCLSFLSMKTTICNHDSKIEVPIHFPQTIENVILPKWKHISSTRNNATNSKDETDELSIDLQESCHQFLSFFDNKEEQKLKKSIEIGSTTLLLFHSFRILVESQSSHLPQLKHHDNDFARDKKMITVKNGWEKLCFEISNMLKEKVEHERIDDQKRNVKMSCGVIVLIPLILSLWGSMNGFKNVPETMFRGVPMEKELTNISCRLMQFNVMNK